MTSDLFLLTRDKSQSITPVGELLVCSTGAATMTAESMHEHIDLIERYRREGGKIYSILQYSPVQVISTKNRAIIDARSKDIGLDQVRRLCLISDSALIRGAVTAIGWISRGTMKTRACERSDWQTALDWLSETANFNMSDAGVALRRVTEAVGLPPLIVTRKKD